MAGYKSFGFRLSEEEVMLIERIVIDEDKDEALAFVKKILHRRLAEQQSNKLKSHLDTPNPTSAFAAKTKQ